MRQPTRGACVAFLAIAAGACAGDEDLGVTESAVDVDAFLLPALSDAERAEIVHRYERLDPDNVIPRGLLEDAIIYFDVNQARIPKTSYFVVVDLSLYSGLDRFWLVDLATGDVEKHKVAHGDGSDPDNNGYATLFSNVEGSHKSSLGFSLTGEIYNGTHTHSMRLDGLSSDGSPNAMANTAMRERLVVVHEASYVDDGNTSQQGRSNGCLALDPSVEVGVVDKIHDGSLIYTAISSLAAPVGRVACGDAVCDGDETMASCPADCGTGPDHPGDDPGENEVPEDDVSPGGCSTGGGAGLLFGFAAVLLRRRRRS